ncbi:MAG TPA: bifunctional folylpolyglutamate synthase/dihydrofolate synthase, partial [Corynebacterium sp.]|nr:bifunctional folylpolyglutamate synthase/dihydrofolate synthase [Corynebacterium sp.]
MTSPTTEDDIEEDSAEDLGEDLKEFGDVTLTEEGLTLNLGGANLDEEREAPAAAEVTDAEWADLARADAELNLRWPETQIEPSLERIELLMDVLGSPQHSFKSIHVAGTNGKTSTVRMIESLLRAFHRRTGRTTSPHLQTVTERIALDGAPIHPRDFVRIWEEIKPYVELVDQRTGTPMSKFEVLVALAYAAFADAPVDVAVVEV